MRLRIALALAACAAAGGGLLAAGTLAPKPGFQIVEERTLYNVFDLGVADLDANGSLERFTINHSAAHFIDPDGERLRLDQDFALPGMEPDGGPPPRRGPARIYVDDTDFVIETDADGAIAGELRIPWRAFASTSGGARAEAQPCEPAATCTIVAFAVESGGAARVRLDPPRSDGFPVRFVLTQGTDVDRVALGRFGLAPPALDFAYSSKDRHAFALSGSGLEPRLFVSRGGARGLLHAADPGARDELFAWDGEGWRDEAATRGLVKDGCPGRQAAFVDANADGLLDLYQVCGRSGLTNANARNRLYLAGEDGSYREAAADFGLDLLGSGMFRFVASTEPGRPPDMLWATTQAISLYEPGPDGRFVEAWRLARKGLPNEKLVVADLGPDGGAAAVVFSSAGNVLVPLSEGEPRLVPFAALGLPEASAEGAVLDIDADGRLDVVTVPQGLFLGASRGFESSPLLDLGWVHPRAQVRLAFFDHGEDGDLDLWLAVNGGDAAPRLARALYARAPGPGRSLLEAAFGRDRLLQHRWLSVVYENTLDHGRVVRVAAPASGVVRVETDGPGGSRSLVLRAGRDEQSRFSATLHDVFLALPPGRRVVTRDGRES